MADVDRRPVVLAVDDDPQVLRAVRRDLRRSYSGDYRVITVPSAAEALEVLDELASRGEEPALLLSDQRMPGTTGVEFLRRSLTLFPDARRVLLTAYADTDAAIAAINEARLDHYLMKPWDPPEERLYPVLDDLLGDWQAARNSKWQGVRVIGMRFSPHTHEVRDFLTRQLVPFKYTEAESSPEATEGQAIPIVEFPDGSRLTAPTIPELAAHLGLPTIAERQAYDLVIVGAGPSGLAAAVYGASEGLTTLAVEREAPGGQAGTSSRIENYLGFPAGLSGGQLAQRATAQARRLGAEILAPQAVTGLRLEDTVKVVTLSDGSEITAQALVLATGVSYNRLNVPGAAELEGAGLYYGAAMTEAMSCAGQTVYVVGGANSAGQGAMYFSRYARHVIMLIRGESLEKSMSQYLIDQISATSNIEVRTHTQVLALEGDARLERLRLDTNGTESVVEADALFTFIGAAPRTDWLPPQITRDERGFLITGTDLDNDCLVAAGWPNSRLPFLLETSVPGIFATGDVRAGAMRRVASAVGEGAMAVAFTHQFLAVP